MATTVSSLEHKTNVELNNLRIKLQNQLKKDIFRLYSDSIFADLSIYVENETIKLHSCILQTRAPAFYSFYCQKPDLIKFVPCHKLRIFFKEIYYASEIKSKEDELLKCIESAFSVDKPLSLEGSSDFELSHYFSINDSFVGTSTPKLHLLRDLSKSSTCVSYSHFQNSDNTVYYSLVDESLVLSDFSDINEDPSRGMNKRPDLTKSASWEMNDASRDPPAIDEAVPKKCVTANVVDPTPKAIVDSTPKVTVDSTPKAKVDSTPKATVDSTPKATVDSTPKATVDSMPKATVDSTPKAKVDSTPKATVDSTHKAVVELISIGDLLQDVEKEPKSDPPARKFFTNEGEPNSNDCPSARVRKFFIDASDLIDEDAANGEKIAPVTESCESRTSPLICEPKVESNSSVIPEERICQKRQFESTCAPLRAENLSNENEVETSCTVSLRNAKISVNLRSTCNEKWDEPVETSCNVVLRREKNEAPKVEPVPPQNDVTYVDSKTESSYNVPLRREKLYEQTPDSLDDDPQSNECNQHSPADLRNKLENEFLQASLTERSCDPIPAQRSCEPVPAQRRIDLQPAQRSFDLLPAPRSCDPIPARRSCNLVPAQRSCDALLAQRSYDPLPAQRSYDSLPAQSCENENHSCVSIPAVSFDVFKTYLIEKYDCARKNHAYSDDELQRLKVFDELVAQDYAFAYVKCDLEEMLASGSTKSRVAMHKFLVKQYEKHHKSTYSSVKALIVDFLNRQEGKEAKCIQTPDSLNGDDCGEGADDAVVIEVDKLFKKLLKISTPSIQPEPQEPPVTTRSCGFFIDLKESPKPRAEAKEKSLPSKQLFSMFIDLGNSTDSDSSLEVQNRLERRKKQYISKLEKSRELRISATSLNEVEPPVGRKLEKIVQSTPLSRSVVSTSERSTDETKSVDTSAVVMRHTKKSNGTPHANAIRRSWNVDKTNEINQNTVSKHKRSYSVSTHQYEATAGAAYTVDVNSNHEEGAADFPSIGNADSTNELTVNGESEMSNSHSYSEGGDARTPSSVSNSISARMSANGGPKSEEICAKGKEKAFVKLSDMDKEPKTSSTDQWSSVRMTKSAIGTEASWFETKLLNGSVNSRSLSRIFPDLSASVLSKPNSDVDDTTVSSISSVQSSSAVSTCESNPELSNNASKSDNNTLGQDLLKMFLEEISTDVVVEVAGRRIKAHKCILTSRCQYFAALLSGGWVESAGNVLSIHGFSFNVVHFALCYIYSGESEIPENISILELASLADYLCLEGLKEVVSCTLKMRYCHFFHKPCNICSVGVLECLPIAVNYGLDDIHRKSLRWITKHYVRLWCSKAFATLPRELIDKCYNQHVVNMNVTNVFETLTNCDKLFTLIPQSRWAEPCFAVTRKLHDFCIKYMANHFVEFLKSDAFMSIATNRTWGIIIMDEKTQLACSKMRSDQLCHSYAYISAQCKLAMASHENEELIELLNRVKHQIETALVKIALQACQCSAWFQMDSELRSHIQTSAGLTFVPSEVKRRAETFKPRPSTISSGSRSIDLQQVKTAINRQHRQANSVRSHEVKSAKQSANQKSASHHGRSASARQNGSHGSQNKENKGSSTKASSHASSKSPFRNKYANVRSRYMDKSAKNERASETTPSETSEADRRPPPANKRAGSKSLASSVHLSPGASLRQTARAVSLSKIPVSVRTSSQKRADSAGDTTSGSDSGARADRRHAGADCAKPSAGARRPASSRGATNGATARKSHGSADSAPTRSTRPQSASAARRKAGAGGAVAKNGVAKRRVAAEADAVTADSGSDAKCPSQPSSGKTSVSEEIARPDVPFRRDGTFCIDEPTVLKKHSPTCEQADL